MKFVGNKGAGHASKPLAKSGTMGHVFGIPAGARDHVEMPTALDNGLLFEDDVKVKPHLGQVAIGQLATKFAAACR